MKRLSPLVVALFIATSCSSLPSRYAEAPRETTLKPGAELVELTEVVSDDRLEDFEELRTVECAMGMNFSPAEQNVAVCENYLRNEAYLSSAPIVWAKREWKQVGTKRECRNCVEMRAVLLVPKSSIHYRRTSQK